MPSNRRILTELAIVRYSMAGIFYSAVGVFFMGIIAIGVEVRGLLFCLANIVLFLLLSWRTSKKSARRLFKEISTTEVLNTLIISSAIMLVVMSFFINFSALLKITGIMFLWVIFYSSSFNNELLKHLPKKSGRSHHKPTTVKKRGR